MMGNKGAERRLKRQYKEQMKYLKWSSKVLGCLAMGTIWCGLLWHNGGYTSGQMELQNHPEKYYNDDELPESWDYFDKYHVWLAILAGALIFLMGFFAMAVHYRLPICKHRKFPAFSHLVAAIVLVIAVLFIIAYVSNVYQATCGENGYVTRKNKEIEVMNNKTGKDAVKWTEFNCPAAVFLSTSSIPTRLNADNKDWPGRMDFLTVFFVLSGLFALCQGIQCVRIFLLDSSRETTKGRSSPTRGKGDDDSFSLSSRSSFDSGL